VTIRVNLIVLLYRMCATKQLYEETECEREAGLWKTGKREQVQLEQTTQIGNKEMGIKNCLQCVLIQG
jgi:hypothetical protein